MAKTVIASRVVDRTTTIRKRVKLTPDRCRICGLSITELNGFPPFDQLDGSLQARVKAALKSHHTKMHPTETKPVIDEEDVPRQWLSGSNNAGNQAPPVRGWSVNKRLATQDDV